MDGLISKEERLERLKEHMHLFAEMKRVDVSEYERAKVSISGLTSFIRENNTRYALKSLKAGFNQEEVECVVACGFFNQLESALPPCGRVDLLDYLATLISAVGRTVGLATFQNGIMNTARNFRDMGELVISHFPEKPLCIGLYNPILFETSKIRGLLHHKDRLKSHFDKVGAEKGHTRVVARTYAFFKTLMDKMQKVDPNLIWIHVAHSEGAAIAHLALKEIAERNGIGLFKRNLITIAVGPIMPIPIDWTLDSYNIYSEGDYLVKGFKEEFDKNPGPYKYNMHPTSKDGSSGVSKFVSELDAAGAHGIASGLIRAVDYLLPDHAFASPTYQKALKKHLLEIKKNLREGKYEKIIK